MPEVGLVLLSFGGFGCLFLLDYWLGVGFAWGLGSGRQNPADEISFEAIGFEDCLARHDCSGYWIGDYRTGFIG